MSRIAIIGECMLELSQNRNNFGKNYDLRYAGDTLNVALYCARWGGSVDYVTAIGDDPFSVEMYEDWQKENIGIGLVKKVPKRQSGLYMVETDEHGERRFYYWRENSPARDLFTLKNCDAMLERLSAFEYIYFSGITLSLYDPKSLDIFYNFLKCYKKNGGKIVFDLNYRPAGWKSRQRAGEVFNHFIPLVNIAMPGQDDEQALTGESAPEKIIDRYVNFGADEVVLKCGKSGCVTFHKGVSEIISTDVISKPYDTTAAGDAFNGAYLAARLSGRNIRDAVRYGQKCASLVIQHPGAIVSRTDWPEDYAL